MIDLAFAAGNGEGFSSGSEAEEQTTTLALPAAPSDALVESPAPVAWPLAEKHPRQLVPPNSLWGTQLTEVAPDFTPARAFEGPRPGMCFKKGKHGLGYYTDVLAPQDQAEELGKERKEMLPNGVPRSRIHSNEQTKYFIIKSSTHRNLVLSVENSVWATPQANEEKFNKALFHSSYVVLIFSVQQSGHFQGYAKMLSPVGSARKNRIFPGFEGRHFDIRWLRLEDVSFSKVTNICNPWNEDKSVKISRDGQELPNDVGRMLCELFDSQVYASDPGSYVSDLNEEETGPGRFHLDPTPYPGYSAYMLPPPLHAMGLPPPSFPPWAHYPAAAHGCPAGYVLTPHATLPNQKSCNGASLPEDPGSLSVPGGLRSSSSSPSPARKKRRRQDEVGSSKSASHQESENVSRRRRKRCPEGEFTDDTRENRHRRIRLTPCAEVDLRWQ